VFLILAAAALSGATKSEVATATPIQHLVVIFQENVSFDHYFATYPNALNPPGEPSFSAKADTPTVNGLAGALLTQNPNSAQPFRLSRLQQLTCDQQHDYTPEQQAMIKELQTQVQTLQTQADVVIVLREGSSGEKLSTYPNPVVNAMTVSINTQSTGAGTLSIFDSGGKLIRQMNIDIHQGPNAFELSLPGAAAGYYTVRLDWGHQMHKQVSFVKTN